MPTTDFQPSASNEHDHEHEHHHGHHGHHHHSQHQRPKDTHHHHHASLWARIQGGLSALFSYLTHAPLALGCASLALLPCIYDGGHEWWMPIFTMCMVLAYATWLLSYWWRGIKEEGIKFHAITYIFIIPIVWGIIQLIPCRLLVRILSPNASEIWSDFNESVTTPVLQKLSLNPGNTMEYVFVTFLCLGLFIILYSKIRTERLIRYGLLSIVLAALGNALLAFYLFFTSQHPQVGTSFSGAFLNRNHFALMMNMGIFANLGLQTAISLSPKRDRNGSNLASAKLAVPLIFSLFVMITAQFLSLSRGGATATLIGFSFFGLNWFVKRKKMGHHRRQQTIAVAVIVSLALAYALPAVMEKLAERFNTLAPNEVTMDARWLLWKNTTDVIIKFPLTGSGMGSYGNVIQRYERGNFNNAFIEHAHNDFLELVADNGIPFALVIFGLLGWFWYKTYKHILHRHSPIQFWGGIAMLTLMLTAMTQELFDFNLQAWPNAIVFTAAMAIAAVIAKAHRDHLERVPANDEPAKMSREQHLELRKTRFNKRIPLLVAGLAVLLLVIPTRNYFLAARAREKLANTIKNLNPLAHPGQRVYGRCFSLLKTAEKTWKHSSFLLQQQAILAACRAQDTDNHVDGDWQMACRYIDEAARLAPADGLTSILRARFHNRAWLLRENQDDILHLALLYNLAYYCQPTLSLIAAETTLQNFDFYSWLELNDPEEAKKYKVQMIQRTSDAITHTKGNNAALFEVYFYLIQDPTKMVAYAPDNDKARLSLMRLLVSQNYLQEAIELSEKLLAKWGSEIDTPEQQEIFNIYCAVLERTRQLDKRANVWDAYWNSRRWSPIINEIKQAMESGDIRHAQSLVNQNIESFARVPAFILLGVELSAFNGKKQDVITDLLNITYPCAPEPTTLELNKAIKYVSHPQPKVSDDIYAIRNDFIYSAINVMLSEKSYDQQKVKSATERLRMLDERQDALAPKTWLQRHLITFYLARAYLLQEKQAEAVNYLQKTLELCPNHYQSLSLMKKIQPELLSAEQERLLNIITKHVMPISHFTSAVSWYTIEAEPQTITKLHESVDFSYFFICNADVRRSLNLSMTFSDVDGAIFSDPINFIHGQEMTWRVGQLIEVKHKLQPISQTLSSQQRMISDGTVNVMAVFENAHPIPITHAFNVRKPASQPDDNQP